MFRRRPALPTRPKYPDNGSILEDLESTKENDVVFTIHPSISNSSSEFGLKFVPCHPTYDANVDDNDLDTPNKAYLKVKSFSEKFQFVETNQSALEGQKQKLLELKDSLEAEMKNIKNEFSKTG